MAERDPVDLIREQSIQMEHLAGLNPEHDVFKGWFAQTRTILEKAFSPRSVHVQSFVALRFREVTVKAFASPEIDKINAARYKRDLETARNILQGAIKELTLDRTLFKKLQTTPKTVEVSLHGECYLSLGFSDPALISAIESALEGTGLKVLRGSEEGKTPPLPQRLEKIRRARLGIYDVSTPGHAEALLELGIALGLGKETVVIHRKGSDLPEGIQSLDRIEYGDFSSLTEKLKKRIGLSR